MRDWDDSIGLTRWRIANLHKTHYDLLLAYNMTAREPTSNGHTSHLRLTQFVATLICCSVVATSGQLERIAYPQMAPPFITGSSWRTGGNPSRAPDLLSTASQRPQRRLQLEPIDSPVEYLKSGVKFQRFVEPLRTLTQHVVTCYNMFDNLDASTSESKCHILVFHEIYAHI